jgi:hypothetical protein
MVKFISKNYGRLNSIACYLILIAFFVLPALVIEPSKAEARFGLTTYDATSITLMAADALNLDGQTGWSFYNGGDAPEGGFITDNTNPATQTFTITLPTSLNSGTTYYIFLYGIGYDHYNTIDCVIGGSTSTTVTADDRDVNRIWTSFLCQTTG